MSRPVDKPYEDPREQAVSQPPDSHALDVPLGLDACRECGQLIAMHTSVNGTWLGCDGALKRALEASLLAQHRKIMTVYGEPYPAVTVAIRAALMTKCGPAMAAFLRTVPHDELLCIAHECSTAAVEAYTRSLGK